MRHVLIFLATVFALGDGLPVEDVGKSGQHRQPYVVNDTGQTTVYDNGGRRVTVKPGERFYGQDAHYSTNPMRFRDNGDGTVTDLNTGLMWVKTPDLANKATFEEAKAGAPKCRIGGYSDWRLPTIKELYSLINFSGGMGHNPPQPYLDTRYFDFVYGDPDKGEREIDAQYWSATEYVGLTMRGNATVFGVNFADGRIKGYPRDRTPRGRGPQGDDVRIYHYVRAVRGGVSQVQAGTEPDPSDRVAPPPPTYVFSQLLHVESVQLAAAFGSQSSLPIEKQSGSKLHALHMSAQIGLSLAKHTPPDRDVKEIQINASTVVGKIRSLLGTNRGPLFYPRDPGGEAGSLVESYRRMGIDFIRTHDFYGPTDWHVIFPTWTADPDDPASYDFTSSDVRIKAIVENSFGCFYRLGTSWKGRRTEPINDPPGTIRDADGRVTHVADQADFEKWAKICAQTVRHYTQGWKNGFRFPIQYWEIWNEPDLAAQFWTGTPEQYYALYAEAARALKTVNPDLKVGGPACTGGLREPYVEGFIRFCRDHRVPLDFFSWHSYGGRNEFNPYQFYLDARRIRKALDEHGFAKAENIITEWNAGIQQRLFSDTPEGVAFYASTLACLLDAGVDRAFQYCGDRHPGLGLHDLGTGEAKICGDAFLAWKQLLSTPDRLLAKGSDDRGYNVVAGKSPDSRRVQVLISDYQSRHTAFRLRVTNLPWPADAPVTLRRWQVDREHRWRMVEETATSGLEISLERPFRSEAVCLVELANRLGASKPPVSANMSLEEIARALEAYPPRWEFGDQREQIMASLDRHVTVQIRKGWTDAEHPQLKPLHEFYLKRVDAGLDKLEHTRVTNGVHAFKFYSSSYVFKTAQGTVAVDFCQGPINNGGEPETRDEYGSGFSWTPAQRDRLARLVDVMLITHRHHDHADYSLAKRLAAQGKTVIGPAQLKTLWKEFASHITVPDYGKAQQFGPVELCAMLGSQYSRNEPTSNGTERIDVPNNENPGQDSETIVYLFRLGGIVFLTGGENHVPAADWLRRRAAMGFKPNVRMSLGQFQGDRSLASVLATWKPTFWLPVHEYEMMHAQGGNRTARLMRGNNRAAFDRREMMPLLWGEDFHVTEKVIAFTR